MDIISIHKYKSFFSLLLTSLLIGSILIKPIHILLIHHEQTELTNIDPDHKTLSVLQDNNCAICDLGFYFFIPQKQVIVPQVNITYTFELAPRMVACFV